MNNRQLKTRLCGGSSAMRNISEKKQDELVDKGLTAAKWVLIGGASLFALTVVAGFVFIKADESKA